MATNGTARAAPPAISVAEYQARIAAAQEAMAEERLDALLVTSEDNYRYLSGFDAPVWQNLTRPRYLVLPRAGAPILILPAGNTVIAERTTPWIDDVRTWVAPDPVDDGVSLVVDALKACAGPSARIGAELGPESRLTMPVGDFLRIRDGIAPAEVVDGDAKIRRLRLVK